MQRHAMQSIANLSQTEKLQMMEALWRDLSLNASEIPSPAWHATALKQAEKAVQNNSAQFFEWSNAKSKLRRSHS